MLELLQRLDVVPKAHDLQVVDGEVEVGRPVEPHFFIHLVGGGHSLGGVEDQLWDSFFSCFGDAGFGKQLADAEASIGMVDGEETDAGSVFLLGGDAAARTVVLHVGKEDDRPADGSVFIDGDEDFSAWLLCEVADVSQHPVIVGVFFGFMKARQFGAEPHGEFTDGVILGWCGVPDFHVGEGVVLVLFSFARES